MKTPEERLEALERDYAAILTHLVTIYDAIDTLQKEELKKEDDEKH